MPTLQEIAEHVGVETAMALVQVWGGMRLYVPRTASASHAIAQDIGLDALAALVDLCGGETIAVPKVDFTHVRKARIAKMMHARGFSERQIAHALETSITRVTKMLDGASASELQAQHEWETTP